MNKSLGLVFAAIILATSAAYAHDDTITTFNVSGTAKNLTSGNLGTCTSGSTCAFSGTLGVDVTSGAVNGLDITFPGLSAFDSFTHSIATAGSGWDLTMWNNGNTGDHSAIQFNTTPTSGSLVGFNGGIITGNSVISPSAASLYEILGGTIALPTTSSVPEPGSLVLMLAGFSALSFFTLRRIRGRVSS